MHVTSVKLLSKPPNESICTGFKKLWEVLYPVLWLGMRLNQGQKMRDANRLIPMENESAHFVTCFGLDLFHFGISPFCLPHLLRLCE